MKTGKNNLLTFAVLALGWLAVAVINLVPLHSPDYWLHAKLGEIILASKGIPRTVLFAYGPAAEFPVISHEWLAAAMIGVIDQFLGVNGAVVARCLSALAIFWLLKRLARDQGCGEPVATAIALASLLVLNIRTLMRPELFAYLFFVTNLIFIIRYRKTAQPRWLIYYLMIGVLWANVHGSFLINIIVPLMFFAGDVLDRYVLRKNDRLSMALPGLFVLTLCASLLNPFGWTMIEHAIGIGSSDFINRFIVEWAPTFSMNSFEQRYFWLYLFFSAGSAVLIVARWRVVSGAGMIVWIGFFVLSVQAIRHIAFFALAAAFPVSECLGRLKFGPQGLARLWRSLFIAEVVVIAAFVSFGNAASMRFGFGKQSPLSAAAVEYLRDDKVSGNVFNTYSLGNEIAYWFFPDVHIAIDGRIDAYGEDYFMNYGTIHVGHASVETVRTHMDDNSIGYLILLTQESGGFINAYYSKILKNDWRLVYRDPMIMIIKRRN